jgi:general secretion pathway protein C
MRQWAIRSANVVLFVLGCFLAARIIVSVLAQVAVPEEATISPVTPVALTLRPDAEERQAILERNLFGARIAGEAPDEPPEEELVAVETKLPLQLLGTVASDDESISNAAILDRGTRKHQVVFVGDQLEGHDRVEVIAIRRGTVFLQNGAKRERLDLHEDDAPAGRTRGRARADRRPERESRSARRTTLADRIGQLQGDSAGRTTASLYSQARIIPEWSDGEMVGVRLNQVKPGSLYEKLGIESGDVITSLNGISIDSPQASSRLLTEFTQAEEFTIELQDGEVIEVDAGQLSQMLGDEG